MQVQSYSRCGRWERRMCEGRARAIVSLIRAPQVKAKTSEIQGTCCAAAGLTFTFSPLSCGKQRSANRALLQRRPAIFVFYVARAGCSAPDSR